MMWLLAEATPMTTMSSGEFVGVYLGLCVIVLLLVLAWSRMSDDSMVGGIPRVDRALDPQEIAFMNSGVEGVARLVLHDMVARGYLEVRVEESVFHREQLVARVKGAPPVSYLTPLEREVVQAISEPVAVDDLMTQGLMDRVAPFCAAIEERLVRARLVFGEDGRALRRNVWMAGMVVLLLVVIARAVATFADEAPETSWLGIGIITFVMSAGSGALTSQRRQTRAGERWMEAVRGELGAMRARQTHQGALTARNALLLLAAFGPPHAPAPARARYSPAGEGRA
jgi:uncharacterized protein (TIGR04222 family)